MQLHSLGKVPQHYIMDSGHEVERENIAAHSVILVPGGQRAERN